MPVRTDRKLIELAGVYATAAELALRGWHASPTVGGFPQIDLHAFQMGTGQRRTVQVKTRAPDQKPNAVRLADGKAGTGGGWGIGTWELKEEAIAGLPSVRHSARAGIWSLHGFAVESDIHVFVWIEPIGAAAKFYVIPTSALADLLSGPDEYLGRYKGIVDQPCWIGQGMVTEWEGHWERLDH